MKKTLDSYLRVDTLDFEMHVISICKYIESYCEGNGSKRGIAGSP